MVTDTASPPPFKIVTTKDILIRRCPGAPKKQKSRRDKVRKQYSLLDSPILSFMIEDIEDNCSREENKNSIDASNRLLPPPRTLFPSPSKKRIFPSPSKKRLFHR
mmetsp:Transcript_36744/g.41892  ORF Transcript_36744/g.41892 Transcript_36744/m.41892 type:complete len:105 (+) Transcript_36744:66-380(+)